MRLMALMIVLLGTPSISWSQEPPHQPRFTQSNTVGAHHGP